MKIENNKIIECTGFELLLYWLKHYSDLIDFGSYMKRSKALGTVIKEDEEDEYDEYDADSD